MELLIAGLVGIAASVLAIELGAWAPRVSIWIVEIAIRRLPEEQHEHYREEWTALLADLPSPLAKLVNAVSLFASIGKISFLCNIDRSFVFKIDDCTLYLSLEQGIVCFRGTTVQIFNEKSELEQFLHSIDGNIQEKEVRELMIELAWVALRGSRVIGAEEFLLRFVDVMDDHGLSDLISR